MDILWQQLGDDLRELGGLQQETVVTEIGSDLEILCARDHRSPLLDMERREEPVRVDGHDGRARLDARERLGDAAAAAPDVVADDRGADAVV